MDDARRCRAKLSDGSGRRCKKAAILGGKTCATHGSSTANARAAAKARLAAAVDPAITTLLMAMATARAKEDVNGMIKSAVAFLDRTGYHARAVVELEGEGAGPVKAQIDWSKVPDDALRALLAAKEGEEE